jgi:hypothetical protein
MQSSNIPAKFPIPFASGAGAGYTRPVPTTTGDPTAASLTLGFPPETFISPSAGGSPPNGEDVNGILNQMTAWEQWFSAGGPVAYDATFQAAIGGYPKGAIVQSVTTFGLLWLCTVENNTTNPDTGGTGWQSLFQSIPGVGAQFQFVSSTTAQLAPLDGGNLWINGVNYAVPASLTISNGGLTASTTYYVYAWMNAGVMALQASTTGYTLAANGIPQKTGDATRTLVGLVAVNASGNFYYMGTLSWFKRQQKFARTQLQNDTSGSSSTLAEISSTMRIPFACWAGAMTAWYINTQAKSTGTGGGIATTAAFDGIVGEPSTSNGNVAAAGSYELNSCSDVKSGLSEGSHYATAVGAVGGGNTATWTGFNSTNLGCLTLTVVVWG